MYICICVFVMCNTIGRQPLLICMRYMLLYVITPSPLRGFLNHAIFVSCRWVIIRSPRRSKRIITCACSIRRHLGRRHHWPSLTVVITRVIVFTSILSQLFLCYCSILLTAYTITIRPGTHTHTHMCNTPLGKTLWKNKIVINLLLF